MAAATPEPRRRSSYLAAFSTVRSRRLAPARTHMTAASRNQLDQLAAHTWRVMFVGPLWGVRMTNKRELTTVLRRLERLVRLELDQTTEYKGMTVEAAVVDALLDGHSSVPCLRLTVRAPERPASLAELLLCNDEAVGRSLPASCEGQCVWLPLAFCRGAAAVLDARAPGALR
ncbi:uncharacterized protein LOC119105591 [Pollicipes pollicipes]|uniref:uncharacterized protein LOC119105591 n=1 Tax=Pollicipes pollicipes TaxID=41117 RepID=UPI0018852997|nr:uncharacterized protein LOC119105591 [Pollicipes pollicipes]